MPSENSMASRTEPTGAEAGTLIAQLLKEASLIPPADKRSVALEARSDNLIDASLKIQFSSKRNKRFKICLSAKVRSKRDPV